MRVLSSALKHGITPEDIEYVVTYSRAMYVLEDDPRKVLFLGFSRSGFPIEVIAVFDDTGGLVIIHAMKETRKFHLIGRKGNSHGN